MNNPLIWQVLLGLLVLAALILGIYSTRSWRAWDIVAGYLIFFAAVGLLVLTALSLKTRRTWLEKMDRLQRISRG